VLTLRRGKMNAKRSRHDLYAT